VKEGIYKALGRALACRSSVGDGSLAGLLERAAWEIDHECRGEFASLAIVVRRENGEYFIGRPKEAPVLPAETLIGMLVEEGDIKTPCRVRDHALDTVRFLDARFRGSIVTRIAIPKELLGRSEAIIWFGLSSIATPKQVNSARIISDAFSEWLAIYFPVIESLRLYSERTAGLRGKIEQMTGVAHDVKAPLAALKYLISDAATDHPQIYEEACRLRDELTYAEALLARCAPSGLCEEVQKQRPRDIVNLVDIERVIRRVEGRFENQAVEQGCRFKLLLPHGTRSTGEVGELDLERALSNVVGNAVRYSGPGEICIELKRVNREQKSAGFFWMIRVSDRGPGIPQSVIDSLALGKRVAGRRGTSTGVNGWGVGLLSSRSSLLSQGGDLVISSNQDNSGASVDIFIRSARSEPHATSAPSESRVESLDLANSLVPAEYPSLSDGGVGVTYGDVELVLVDDDVEHTESLAKALSRQGVRAKTFSTVEEATQFIASNPKATVLCDTHMPNGEGAEYLLRLLARDNIKPRVGVMSGESSDYSLYRFAALGAREFFSKPIDIDRLLCWIAEPSSVTPA
jgi:signal transduction histidine kinase/CheY-like chemotaxis protein